MEIYVVEKLSGSYEDSNTVLERAFVREEDARAFAEEMNAENTKINEACDRLSESNIFYDDVIVKVFRKKLEAEDADFLKKVRTVWDKADLGEAPLTAHEEEILDEYDIRLYEYTRNYDPEEFFKYAKELGFDDETVETLFRSAPLYTDYSYYDLPYYIVSRPIELVGAENKEIQSYH